MWRHFLNRINLLPYDILNLVFVSFLLFLSLVFKPKLPQDNSLIATYIGLIFFVILASFFPFDFRKRLTFIHLFYPFILIPIVFESLGKLIIYINPHFWDATLASLDKAFCGQYPCLLLKQYANPLLTEILQLAYTSYYFMPPILAIMLFLKRDKRLATVAFGIILGFYASYIGYLFFPALGPRFYLDPPDGIYKGTHLAKHIASFLDAVEKNKTDAFPSGHTQISIMCTYYAQILGPKWAVIYGVLTALLIISTIYCHYHYLADVIAGVFLAAICLRIAPSLEARFKGFSDQIAHFFSSY